MSEFNVFDTNVYPIYPSVDKSKSSKSTSSDNSSSESTPLFAESVKFNDIEEHVLLDLGLTMYDSLALLLGNSQEQGMKFFKSIIERVIREYAQTSPEKMSIKIGTGNKKYEFKDNFKEYLDGSISKEDLILIPIGTPWYLSTALHQNSRSWYYKKPTLYATEYSGILPSGTYGYFAAQPYKLEIGLDGKFTEDSVLYSMDDQRTQDGFFTFLNLEVAQRLRRMINSLSIGGNIEVLPSLDITIQELMENKYKYIRRSSSHLSYMWRK